MKKIIPILICLLFIISNSLLAQNDIPKGLTEIPDPNFEQALIDFGYDEAPINGSVPTENISGLTELFIGDLGISDLTGIQDFANLRKLICYYNYLTELDVSNNLLLTTLRCYNNQLSNLNVSTNSHLEILSCDFNNLEELDLNGLINLDDLWCSDNELTQLDFTNNSKLRKLVCDNNYLTELDITNLLTLQFLNTHNNFITSLDISNNSHIQILRCYNNQLLHLNVQNGTNTSFETFIATGNPDLTCIQVDNASWAEDHWSEFADPLVIFSEDCSTVFIKEDVKNSNIELYPSPVHDVIHFRWESQTPVSNELSLSIINSLGENMVDIQISQATQSLNLKHYPSGLYIFIIKEQGEIVELHKVIKK